MRTAIALILIVFATSAWRIPSSPVETGGSATDDACSAQGVVLATTVLLTSAEAGKAQVKSVVPAGTVVNFCDLKSSEQGDFIGVVVQEEGVECGTASPQPERKPYQGPCKSGWIKKDFLILTAG